MRFSMGGNPPNSVFCEPGPPHRTHPRWILRGGSGRPRGHWYGFGLHGTRLSSTVEAGARGDRCENTAVSEPSRFESTVVIVPAS